MISVGPVTSYQTRRLMLVAATILWGAGLASAMALNDESAGALVRAVVAVIVIGISIWEATHEARVEALGWFLVTVYAVLALLDTFRGTEVSAFDYGATLALLLLIAVLYVTVREAHSVWPVMTMSAIIAAYSIMTVAGVEMTFPIAAGFLLLGGPGQAVALWMISRLMKALDEKVALEARQARFQAALASCSQALLNRGTKEPLNTALEALLEATDAGFAYVDVNRTDSTGYLTWEIVAQARGSSYPEKPGTFVSGDYTQLGELVKKMEAREAAVVVTSELPMPIRGEYEAEKIKSEVLAPIFIGDKWIGSLGYTDYVRGSRWSDVEIAGLMRAAEMVGAYWEREAAREGLVELAKAKDRFIAAVSHELRTPLAAVVGFAGEMVRGIAEFSEEERLEIASLIYTQSLEVSHLVDDLLTAERAASGNLTVTPENVFLLQECRDVVASTAGDLHVEVEGDEIEARSDSFRTRQILRNLLTNAGRYGGSAVRMEVSAAADTAMIVVMDDGPGVRGVEAEHIFDPYYRSQGPESKPDSVGLGLSVARQLARLMGGDLVYRRFQGWTRFELTLPLARSASLTAVE